ncbi:hypothetical protein GCM10027046_20960 [Uliginosibacterium flavum]|uniref:Family 43 glycosylhydrolase n=1 Tax=Uliginosibacterium flavum TaxID=1396831 RepID=A0ABV2TQP7_9RHOO
MNSHPAEPESRPKHGGRFAARLVCCFTLLLTLHGALGATITNPLMPGADPHAISIGQSVWIYPTWSKGAAPQFFAFASEDLQHWQRHGPVLDFADVSWIKDDGQAQHFPWAPAIIERQGVFYFYYSVGPQRQTPARIGVARGDTPAGPFRDSGKPLLTGEKGFEAIDPMVFLDPQSGKYLLYAGGSAGAGLKVFELNDDLISIAREIKTGRPPKFTEGAFMHYAEGIYHLTYSHGRWREASYSVHYATALTPTGPWTYRGALLESDNKHKGPGHHSIIQDPANGQWLIVYHRWNGTSGDGPYKGMRRVAIERIEYGADGAILPIRMSDAWTR